MDPMEQNSQDEKPVRNEPESVRSAKHSRRAFLFKLSLLANGAVGAVLAVPSHRVPSGAGDEEGL